MRRSATWASLLVGSFLLLWVPSPANAISCGTANAHFVSEKYDADSWKVRGAQTDLDIRPGDTCTGNPYAESSAWAMLMRPNGAGYAQIGYLWKSNGNSRYFFEWTKGSSGSVVVNGEWGNPTVNDNVNFKVSYYPSDNRIHLLIHFDNVPPCDGSDCPVTNFDPVFGQDSWPDILAQFAAETDDNGSNIVGTSSSKADFYYVEEKNSSDNWASHNWNGGFAPDRCYYHRDEVDSDSHFRVWTAPLDHSC